MGVDVDDPASIKRENAATLRRERITRFMVVLGSLQGYIGLILIVAYGILSKGDIFWNGTNLTNAVGAFSSRGILAVGETLVILIAGIDLSVGSMLGFCSMTAALLLTTQNMNPVEIVIISMFVGAILGFLNGAATAWLRIQSFIVTLAMLSIVRGLDRELSNNVSVGTQVVTANGHLTPSSEAFQSLGTPGHNLFTFSLPGAGQVGIYYPVLAFLVVCIIFQFVLTRTSFGRHIYAVGGNETAARLSGVNVTLIKIAVFTLAGILAGFAGPIDAAYSASADPLAGQSFELDAIAAAVIGGASLAGGKGTIIGTLVGALILTLLDNVLGLNAVSDNWQLVIKGLIVVIAVVLQRPGIFSAIFSSVRSIGSRVRPERRGANNSE
ncbi:MAG: ABC transporter permease [Ktedonobacteraceae bacterium]|nr:ABC transporter permease [Chloroflexota bacterium]